MLLSTLGIPIPFVQAEPQKRHNVAQPDARAREEDARKGPWGKFDHYAPLNAPHSWIYQEVMSIVFKNIPKPMPLKKQGNDKGKFYDFHEDHGQSTDECVHMKDAIE